PSGEGRGRAVRRAGGVRQGGRRGLRLPRARGADRLRPQEASAGVRGRAYPPEAGRGQGPPAAAGRSRLDRGVRQRRGGGGVDGRELPRQGAVAGAVRSRRGGAGGVAGGGRAALGVGGALTASRKRLRKKSQTVTAPTVSAPAPTAPCAPR